MVRSDTGIHPRIGSESDSRRAVCKVVPRFKVINMKNSGYHAMGPTGLAGARRSASCYR